MADSEPVLLAEVAVDAPGRDSYTYLVPDELAESLAVGDAVAVPFGPRRERGFVVALARRGPPAGVALKTVAARRSDLRLPPHLLALIAWASRYYRCPLGTFLSAAVPAPVRSGTTRRPQRLVQKVSGWSGQLTEKQRQVLALLPEDALPGPAACKRSGCDLAMLRRLAALGALVISETATIAEVAVPVRAEDHALTGEQQAVVAAVAGAMVAGRHQAFLLYGVTGSGKTLCYFTLAAQAIAAGRQVLVLLPEIGLTPQLAARFRQRFPRVAVWHSAFADGERAEQWRRVAAGEVDLVIGTRSALFAPLPRPGLLIVDEEHDQSYKQESEPRYQARDLAVVYAGQLGVPVLLGSATPSLETYRNVQQERYRVLVLRNRPGGGRLPTPLVVDMAEEARQQQGKAVISRELESRLTEARQRGEQAIVLLNRRGWSPIVSCLACGHVMECASCDIGLTWHRGADLLRCHYCGHAEGYPRRCPACGSADLSAKGMGTEQLAAELSRRLPALRILRLDADTVGSRQGHAKVLAAFAAGEADCLVGTQMVAKGLDFPNVTVVGVVAADQGLHIPDFRAAERTYQLIAQVSGRAGRGERPGVVVVQAYDAKAPAIHCALRNQPKTFYTDELAGRERYGYPPHAGLVRFLWRSPDAAKVQLVAEEDAVRLRQAAAEGELVLGPTPAGIAFLQGQHRFHLLVKATSRGVAQRYLDRVQDLGWLKERRGVKVAVDVDPYTIS